MPVLPDILQPAIVNGSISQLRVQNSVLQSFFGASLRQRMPESDDYVGATTQQSGRYFGYDVFNETRNVARGRAPGAASGTAAVHPVGHVAGVFPRVFEKTPIAAELVHNMRQIGGPAGTLDRRGEVYIRKQEQIVAQEVTNKVEFQFAAMMRGGWDFSISGDDYNDTFASGTPMVDFQIPAGNKSQLNMTGGGSIIDAVWSTAGTKIVTHCYNVKAAFENLTGWTLEHIWVTSVVWNHVLNNTEVITKGGQQFAAFDVLERDPITKDFTARLRALPWITWHITDAVLRVNGTTTKLIADTAAVFMPTPDTSWIDYLEGSEPIAEYTGAPVVERFGSYFYIVPTADPTGYHLYKVHNGLPALYVPKNIAYATVTGF